MIILREGGYKNGCIHPTLLADHEVIEQMYKNGSIVVGAIPPSHINVVGHELYGHKIQYSEKTDGREYRQSLTVGEADPEWIAAQTKKKHTHGNPSTAEVLNAGGDALQTYALLDIAGDAIGAVGEALSKSADVVGECVGEIVKGICD